jgi:predicted transposase YbfD/YdcC
VEKAHGRIELRSIRTRPTDPATLGLAGTQQLIRLERIRQTVRQGQIMKTQTEIAYGFTTLSAAEASPTRLLKLCRSHWSIENGQHDRRDRTQDEDRCQVWDTSSARNFSLFRSLTIFLYEQQRDRSDGRKSLPDYQRHVARQWPRLLRHLMPEKE